MRRSGGEVGMGEESEDAEAVVEGDDDGPARGEAGSVIGGQCAGAGGEGSAVNVDEDRRGRRRDAGWRSRC